MISFNNTSELKVAFEAGKIEKPQFISIRNYENNAGEVSNYLINLGTDHTRAKVADLEALKNVSKDSWNMPEDLSEHTEKALTALIASMEKSLSNEKSAQSQAQIDSYEHILPNIKMHKESGKLYIFGKKVKKTVLVEGTYKKVNSRKLTLAKKHITKQLSSSKYRQFTLNKINNIKINGSEIIVEL